MLNSISNACTKIFLFLDIDECLAETDMCAQNCTNTPGSYECSCHNGFDEDGINCIGMNTINVLCNSKICLHTIDINECELDIDDCDSPRVANCINSPGSFSCTCKTGYTGSGRNNTCKGE